MHSSHNNPPYHYVMFFLIISYRGHFRIVEYICLEQRVTSDIIDLGSLVRILSTLIRFPKESKTSPKKKKRSVVYD